MVYDSDGSVPREFPLVFYWSSSYPSLCHVFSKCLCHWAREIVQQVRFMPSMHPTWVCSQEPHIVPKTCQERSLCTKPVVSLINVEYCPQTKQEKTNVCIIVIFKWRPKFRRNLRMIFKLKELCNFSEET